MFEDYQDPSACELDRPTARARVRVVFVDAATSAVFPHDATPLERKRSTVWANTYRNLQIARIADALANYELDSLWQEGLFLGDTEYPEVADGPVSVLVESPEHGQTLSNMLGRWPFLHAMPEPLLDRERFWTLGSSQNTIYSLVAANEIDRFEPQVLINAIGGDWIPEIRSYPPAEPLWELLLIDFADDVDQQAEKATLSRIQQYMMRGWPVQAAPRWLSQFQSSAGAQKRKRQAKRPLTPAAEAQEYLDELNSRR